MAAAAHPAVVVTQYVDIKSDPSAGLAGKQGLAWIKRRHDTFSSWLQP